MAITVVMILFLKRQNSILVIMATLTTAAWTCFMEWKEVLRISVSGNRAYKVATKTKGRKRYIQVCELALNTS